MTPIRQNRHVRTNLSILGGFMVALLVATVADVCPLTSHFAFLHSITDARQHSSAPKGRHDAAHISDDAVLPASVERLTDRSLTAVAPGILPHADPSIVRIGPATRPLTRPFDPSHLHTFALLI